MKIGDMFCPTHPDMTLFECRPLHTRKDMKGWKESPGDNRETYSETGDEIA